MARHPSPSGLIPDCDGETPRVGRWFRRFSVASAEAMGSKWAFFVALLTILAWAVTGPIFHYSDTWQLVINTFTNLATFLMVFVIQNTQNRDAKAIHLKLDELLRGVKGARTHLVNLEEFSDEELDALRDEFERVRNRAARRARSKPESAEQPDQARHVEKTARQVEETADKVRDTAQETREHREKTGR